MFSNKNSQVNNHSSINPKVSAKILGYIGKQKQHSRNFFRFLNLGRILAILGGMVLASLALAVFVWDGWLKFRLSDLTGLKATEVVWDLYFELILIVILIVIFSLLIYRQTDWYFVKDIKWVLMGICLVLVIAAGIITLDAMTEEKIINANKSATIPQIAQTIRQLPYHQNNSSLFWQKLEQKNQFLGVVDSVNLKNKTITTTSVARTKIQTITFKTQNLGLKKFKLKQLVLINFQKNQEDYKATKIKRIDLQNRPKLKELIEHDDLSDPDQTNLLDEAQGL